MQSDDEISFTSTLFRCGHCGNRSPLVIRQSYTKTEIQRDDETGYTHEYGPMYSILECPSCSKMVFTVSDWHDMMESENELSYKVLFPSPSHRPGGLPDKIRKGYEAAEKIKPIDANAYAVLMRRLLELVCEDRNAKGDDLYQKLADLSTKNEIPSKLLKVAHGLRQLGNIGAHAVLGEITSKEIPILKALIDGILEYVYGAPYLAQIAEERFKNLKKMKQKSFIIEPSNENQKSQP